MNSLETTCSLHSAACVDPPPILPSSGCCTGDILGTGQPGREELIPEHLEKQFADSVEVRSC